MCIICNRQLTQYDCITFYNIVEALKTSDKVMRNPGWIFLPAAESLFLHSKERVYGHTKNKVVSRPDVAVPPGNYNTVYFLQNLIWLRNSSAYTTLDELLLEENPKWIALREIVSEVLEELKSLDEPLSANRILIVANDSHTCDQIKEVSSNNTTSHFIRF